MEADIIQDLGLQLTSRSISSLRTEVTQEKNKEKKTVSHLITKRGHNMTLGGSTLLSREGRQPLPLPVLCWFRISLQTAVRVRKNDWAGALGGCPSPPSSCPLDWQFLCNLGDAIGGGKLSYMLDPLLHLHDQCY